MQKPGTKNTIFSHVLLKTAPVSNTATYCQKKKILGQN
jgi:hypothetical protein